MRLTARETTRAHPSPTKHHSPGHQPRKEPTPDLNRLMLKFRKHVMKERKDAPFGHENNEKNVGTGLGATWAPETTLAGALSRKAPSSGFSGFGGRMAPLFDYNWTHHQPCSLAGTSTSSQDWPSTNLSGRMPVHIYHFAKAFEDPCA